VASDGLNSLLRALVLHPLRRSVPAENFVAKFLDGVGEAESEGRDGHRETPYARIRETLIGLGKKMGASAAGLRRELFAISFKSSFSIRPESDVPYDVLATNLAASRTDSFK
jgi:hypothetical protein